MRSALALLALLVLSIATAPPPPAQPAPGAPPGLAALGAPRAAEPLAWGLLPAALAAAFYRGRRRAAPGRKPTGGPELAARRELVLLQARYEAATAELNNHRDRLEAQNALLEQQTRELELRETKLREQAQELTQALVRILEFDEQKSRFFANISHEFRTPLTLILGPVEDVLAGRHGAVDEPVARQLALVRRNGHRLLRLINQILDLSRIENGSIQLQAGRADVVPFLRSLVIAFSGQAEREAKTLSFRSAAERLELYFDPDKLEKIVSNLVSNALKFTPAGGKIHVSVRHAERDGKSFAEIAVRDTGAGIPESEQERVFDRFYQADASTTREHDGSGIGLALARELVWLHGGEIRLESEPGFGSCFYASLPLGDAHLRPEEIRPAGPGAPADAPAFPAAPPPPPEAPAPAAAPEPPPADAPLVLLVEDNPDVRGHLRDHLGARYRIAEAADGREGLEAARRLRPALVVADVMMPGLDGYDLCRALKADGTLGGTPVVLLTARASEEDRLAGLDVRADDYLYKPFSMTELTARVENLIETRRALRERYSGEVVIRPSEVAVPSEEAAFLERVREAIEHRFGDPGFSVETLADEVGLSPRQLQRRVKQLAGMSPAEMVRGMRLERAAQLLERRAAGVSEVAYRVGFSDAEHFSRLFKHRFGVTPSRYPAGATS